MQINSLQLIKIVGAALVLLLSVYFLGSLGKKQPDNKVQQEIEQIKKKNDSLQIVIDSSQTKIKILSDTQTRVLKSAAVLSAKIAIKDRANDSLLKILEAKESTAPDTCKPQITEALNLAESYKSSRDSLRIVNKDLQEALRLDTLKFRERDMQDSIRIHQIKNLNTSVSAAIEALNKEQHQTFLGIPLPSRKTSFVVGTVVGLVGAAAIVTSIK